MLKYWRILLLVVTLLGATLAIGMKAYPYGRYGVEILYVSQDSPASGILEQGMIVTHVNDQEIRDVGDWNSLVSQLTDSVVLRANGKPYTFELNNSLGIEAMDIERTNLDFGLDLRGGTRILLKPKENATRDMIEQIKTTLETRANIYGLKEMRFYPVGGGDEWYIQIEAAGVGSDIVDNLLSRQGKFEAKIIKPVGLESGKGVLQLGTETWDVSVEENGLAVAGEVLQPNGTITLSDIELQYINVSNDRAIFLALVYTGKDIELVYTDPQHSSIMPRGGVYQFYFAVLVSQEGAQKFADVTSGIPRYLDIQSGEEYLESEILLFIDEQLVSNLRISAALGGQLVQTPSIQGSREEYEDALQEKMRLQTILRSGALPTTLEQVSLFVIPPTLGAGFFTSAAMAIILAAIVVVVVVMIRYRNIKVASPMLLVGLSEVIIILGIASTGDQLIWGAVLAINLVIVGLAWWKRQAVDMSGWLALLIPLAGIVGSWTIDLPAIGGIIAAIGTGVDHQIIIADEAIKKRKEEKVTYTLKEKIKRAFFIIFGAAATTFFAMIPLIFLGVGLVRGFAFTTIVGLAVGIFITRPAYARIIEAVVK